MEYLFTDGPWEVEKSKTNDIHWIEDDVGQTICNLYVWPNRGDHLPFENSEANANLIAAAPDMMQTLEDILSILESDGQASWGHTPEDVSNVTYDLHSIDTIKSDIKWVISKAMGAAE